VTSRDEELLAELLLRWEELHERGHDTPAAELAKERADLVTELDRRIRALKAVAWLDAPIDHDSGSDVPHPGRPPVARTLASRYRLDELISEGGFAWVFRAYDTGLQRTVAVKIPKPDKVESQEAIQAEARRAARLKHDGIVPVFDVGLDGGTCYIVTEYVEGGSLADRLAGSRPSSRQTISWLADVADALEYAHLHGVVHRDIKPANILIDHHGRAKLTDFGISQAATPAGAMTAVTMGTLWYMSPEQLSSDATDHRSDIYSLAVVLHEAIDGAPPYRAWEPARLRTEILEGTAMVSPSIRGRLRPILRKALSRSPHQRHASASHFAAEIRRADSSSARRRLWPWWGAGLAALAGAAAGAAGLLALQAK
jgi:serine/threonine protein kinase